MEQSVNRSLTPVHPSHLKTTKGTHEEPRGQVSRIQPLWGTSVSTQTSDSTRGCFQLNPQQSKTSRTRVYESAIKISIHAIPGQRHHQVNAEPQPQGTDLPLFSIDLGGAYFIFCKLMGSCFSNKQDKIEIVISGALRGVSQYILCLTSAITAVNWSSSGWRG